MLNSYDFEDAEKLVEPARDAVPVIRGLVERADEQGVDVIYVNDNFGHWRSSPRELVDTVLEGKHPELVEPIAPRDEHAFVIKARHSVFYQTPLEYLLRMERQVGRIVLTGQVTEQCILYSALDAYIRHFEVVVPRDAVAHIYEDFAESSLGMMERNMRAEVCNAEECELSSG